MLSGSAEPDCCEHPPLLLFGLDRASTGTNEFADDVPDAKVAKLMAHATIDGATCATAVRWAGPTAVN